MGWKVILVLLGGLTTSVGTFAGPLPQEQEKKSHAPARRSAETQGEENPVRTRSTNDQHQEFSATPQHSFTRLGVDFLLDQRQIWTSPAKLRFSDTQWLVPLAGITAGLFVTDGDFSRHLSHNPTTINHYNTLSNAGVGALIGGAGGLWLLGHARHNEHWSETGFLAGEAALNSLVVVESLKYSFGRQRPNEGNGNGQFFQGGVSFPSEHSAAAWSVAGVVAHEYPGPFTKIVAYGLASLVDVSRMRARQHFPSDVVVGSVIGNLVAQNIYSRHHDPGLGGEAWRSISEVFRSGGTPSVRNLGSPYVPLDSWIYPAFDRLAALGLIDSGFAGMRPWTRIECIRLLGDVRDRVETEGLGGAEGEKIYRLLEEEFRDDTEGISNGGPLRAQVESIYSRVTGISGEPLTDGNHFGQTIVNDYGRPYQEGLNSVNGASVWTTSGHWVGYLRAEYQHSPWAPPQAVSARQFIASVDSIPGVPPAAPYPAVNRVQLLDAYVGVNFENWQIMFGKQSLWWSPMQSGPLMLSDNAEPINMFRISRVSPFKLPSILGWLGPMRFEWFLGQFAGHEFVFRTDTGIVGQFGRPLGRQPFLQGQKISLKPTPNFEFSVSATAVFAGGPNPLTWRTFFRSYSLGYTFQSGNLSHPGDRRSGVDFTYKVPGIRNWLTFYGDAFTEDEFSPLGYPRKSAYEGGIYMPRIPGIPKLDLRLEGGSTVPPDFPGCFGCFYVNNEYPDGSYMNLGNLVGSWLGRAGQGMRAWSTYWFSPRNKIQFQYRHQKIDGDYLPRGGTLNDGGVDVDLQLRPQVTFSGSVQYEKWNYPVLAPVTQSNWTTSLGITFYPRSWKK